jgi:hypothetical protein
LLSLSFESSSSSSSSLNPRKVGLDIKIVPIKDNIIEITFVFVNGSFKNK